MNHSFDILKGKTAAFLGDSICMASTFDKEHQWWGWAGRISEAYGLGSYVNKGCDGASVSNCREKNRIIFQLERIKGQKSKDICPILGYKDFDEVIHRDNLSLIL